TAWACRPSPKAWKPPSNRPFCWRTAAAPIKATCPAGRCRSRRSSAGWTTGPSQPGPAESLRLEAALADDALPCRRVGVLALGELLGRHRIDRQAHGGELLLHVGHLHHLRQRAGKLLDERGGRALGGEETVVG